VYVAYCSAEPEGGCWPPCPWDGPHRAAAVRGLGHTNYGDWSSNVTVSPAAFKPGAAVTVNATLKVSAEHLRNLAGAGIKADNFCLLVTAERTFDSAGHLHFPTDQYMSTLLTPAACPLKAARKGPSPRASAARSRRRSICWRRFRWRRPR